MHPPLSNLPFISAEDAWSPTTKLVERVAGFVLGSQEKGWIRPPGRPALIVRRRDGVVIGFETGSRAQAIEAEFSDLAASAGAINARAGRAAVMSAIAFFHIKFVSIHPLTDGNGRVARIFLAYQMHYAFEIDPCECLESLYSRRRNYVRVFSHVSNLSRYQNLVRLLGMNDVKPVDVAMCLARETLGSCSADSLSEALVFHGENHPFA